MTRIGPVCPSKAAASPHPRKKQRRRDGRENVLEAHRRVPETIEGVQGHRKIPSKRESMEIAVAEYGLPTLAEFASCAFQEHLALGISRTERLRRRKNPKDADYEKNAATEPRGITSSPPAASRQFTRTGDARYARDTPA